MVCAEITHTHVPINNKKTYAICNADDCFDAIDAFPGTNAVGANAVADARKKDVTTIENFMMNDDKIYFCVTLIVAFSCRRASRLSNLDQAKSPWLNTSIDVGKQAVGAVLKRKRHRLILVLKKTATIPGCSC